MLCFHITCSCYCAFDSQLAGHLLTAYGSSAPEFESGCYTRQSDVYSFGVVMLELLTGRKAYDRLAIALRISYGHVLLTFRCLILLTQMNHPYGVVLNIVGFV